MHIIDILLKKRNGKLLQNNSGVAAIEFALILPVFILISLGVIEFGVYFVKDEITNDAVSNISLTLQRDPNYFSSLNNTQINTLLQGYGSGLVKFSPIGANTGNYICVDAYSMTDPTAQNAPPCKTTHFNTANPAGPNSTTPFYIAVRADLAKGTLTPLGNFLPIAKQIQVNQSSGIVQIIPPPPQCNQPGQGLSSNGTSFICQNLLWTSCSQPWQRLEYNNGAFGCVNIPYVIAGGIANPRHPGSGTWIKDGGFHTGPDVYYITICDQNIRFTIPAGLPPGQILAQGNLVYPVSAGGNGTWHSWTVSFENMSIPFGGGTGSMWACMSNGGNWNSNQGVTIASEHISWTVTYIPN